MPDGKVFGAGFGAQAPNGRGLPVMPPGSAVKAFKTALGVLREDAGDPSYRSLINAGGCHKPRVSLKRTSLSDWFNAGKPVVPDDTVQFRFLVERLQKLAAKNPNRRAIPDLFDLRTAAEAERRPGRGHDLPGGSVDDTPALPDRPDAPPASSSAVPAGETAGSPASLPKDSARPFPWITRGRVGIAVALVSTVTGLAVFQDHAEFPWERKQTTRRSAPAEPDIRYTVQYQDDGWLLALPVGVEPTPEQQAYLRRWTRTPATDDPYTLDRLAAELRAAGGAELARLTLRVPLTSARGEPIEVDDIRPVNIRRTAPYAGTLVNIPPQDSGATVKMMFDLDEIEPRARVTIDGDDPNPRPGGLFFQGKTLTLNDREDVLTIRSIATTHAVSFDIRIDYRIRNRPGYLLVTNNGRPFAVTPMNCLCGAQAQPTPTAATTARNPALPPIPPKGAPPGPAAYQRIWEMSDSRIVEAADPGHRESASCA